MIEFIFATVCIALDEKYTSWKETGKKLLQDLNKFIDRLLQKIEQIKEQGSDSISEESI